MDRKVKQKMAWDIYQNDYYSHILRKIQTRMNAETEEKYRPNIAPRHNVLKRVAEILAVVYRRPPRRYSQPEEAKDYLRNYVPDLDLVLDEISKLTFALGDVLVAPYFDDNSDIIRIDIIPPHLIHEIEYNRSALESLLIKQGQYFYRYYADGTYVKLVQGRKGLEAKESGDTGLGMLPFVMFSLTPRSYLKPWGIQDNNDLVEGTIEVGILETYHGFTSYLRSFRLPTMSAAELEASGKATPPEIDVAPDTLITYDLKTLELADPADQFWQSITKQVEDLAASRDISPTIMFRRVSKVDEAAAASEELRNRWESQVKIFRGAEGRLLKLIFKILQMEDIWTGDIPEWRIDYMLPSPVLSDPQKNLDVLEKGIKLGVDSPAQFLLREQPDLRSEKEAWEVINKNIEDRAKLVKEMRALNMPADPTQVGNDPSVNGGSQIQQDNQGYNGPPAAPTELTKQEV